MTALLVLLGILAVSKCASAIQSSTEPTTTTGKPFKPSLQINVFDPKEKLPLAAMFEPKDKMDTHLDQQKDLDEKNKRTLNKQIGGYGVTEPASKSMNARSYQYFKQQHPYRFFIPPKMAEGPSRGVEHGQNTNANYAIYLTDKGNENQQVDPQYQAGSAEPTHNYAQVQNTEQQTVEQKLNEQQTAHTPQFVAPVHNYMNQYQPVHLVAPEMLAKAMSNSPYFNPTAAHYTLGGGYAPQPSHPLFTHSPPLYHQPPFSGFNHNLFSHNPFAHSFGSPGYFGHGTPQYIPVIILRVGEGHSGLGPQLLSHQPHYPSTQLNIHAILQNLLSHQNNPQAHTFTSIYPQPHIQIASREVQEPSKSAFNNVYSGLVSRSNFPDYNSFKSSLLPTASTKVVKTEPIVDPRQNVDPRHNVDPATYQEQYKYENYVEKA